MVNNFDPSFLEVKPENRAKINSNLRRNNSKVKGDHDFPRHPPTHTFIMQNQYTNAMSNLRGLIWTRNIRISSVS